MRRPLLTRLAIGMAVGFLVAVPFSELAFRWQGNTTSRPPTTIVLDIPSGTSAKVSNGVSVLPQSIVFVVGDTLLVTNHDSVVHTLGPLVIPPGTSASMVLNHLGNLAYICSFQPTKYLGLDVQGALTVGTRLEGIIIAGIPLGILVTLYSLIVKPIKKKEPVPGIS